jgi:UDP-GlcNAc:undecaprenyl-phosphate GlcNAc-1-phosphate transferase
MNYKKISILYNLYDYPDELRKKHKNPTPLFGGLVIIINIFLYCFVDYISFIEFNFFQNKSEISIFLLFSSLFFFVGYIDDKLSITANLKLLIYILLIFILIFFDNDLIIRKINFSFSDVIFNFQTYSIFFTILCFLLFVNSFNMLDGINGQAGTYSIYISTIFIFLNINPLFFISLIITILFFLYFNFKDKIFLGDSGTILLGFLISYFFIKSYNMGSTITSDEIFLIMMIPGFELLRLAIQRLKNKRHPFSADNNHIHHLFLTRLSFFKSYFLVQFLLFFPFLFYLLIANSFISLIVSSTIYSVTILYFSKKK